MDRLKHDLTVAFRRLRSSPGFTVAAIVTLALGIGANTAIFTAVNAVVFRSLPVERPEELFAVNTQSFKTEFPVLSFPNYRDTRDRSTNMLAGWRRIAWIRSTSAGPPETIRGAGGIWSPGITSTCWA
jgi:putative ABC transport system permease protein